MNDDTLLKSLAAEARAQQDSAIDEKQWERYAEGALSDEEVEALFSQTPPDQIDRLKAIYTPLGQEFENQIAESIREQAISDGTDLSGIDAPDNSGAKVVPLHLNRKKLLAPLALAATLLLALGTWQFGLRLDTYSEVPLYSVAVVGGSSYRSTRITGEIPSFSQGDRLEIRLTPATSLEQKLQSKAFVLKTQSLVPLSGLNIEVAPSGAMRLSGRVGETLELESGLQQLIIVLSSPDKEPRPGVVVDEADRARPLNRMVGNGWQALRVDVYIDE